MGTKTLSMAWWVLACMTWVGCSGDIIGQDADFGDNLDWSAQMAVLGPRLDESLVPARVRASGHDGNVPENTFDGSFTTRWSAKGVGAWIEYDFGKTLQVEKLELAWHRATQRTQKFDVSVGEQPNSMVISHQGLMSDITQSIQFVRMNNVRARYVRITGYGNSMNAWNSLAEVGFYGVSPDVDPEKDTIPPRVNQPAPQPIRENSDMPSRVLDLRSWKLQLPVKASSGSGLETQWQPDLDSYKSVYFFVNTTTRGVVFSTPSNGYGEPTYARTELRETTADGSKNAAWSTTRGTHTLRLTQAITKLPESRKHVIVSQIHGAGSLYILMVRLQDGKLVVQTKESRIPFADYTLGSRFHTRLVASSGKIDVYYSPENGAEKLVYTYPFVHEGCYFKVGSYTQTKSTTDKTPAEIETYALSLTHQ